MYKIVYSLPMAAGSMTVSEARALLPQIVQRVLAGEEITLTRHGQEVAVLIRPDRLRARRADAALSAAAVVHEALAAGRTQALGTVSAETAQEVLQHVKRSRASR